MSWGPVENMNGRDCAMTCLEGTRKQTKMTLFDFSSRAESKVLKVFEECVCYTVAYENFSEAK